MHNVVQLKLYRHFDKDRNGRLEHQEFKSCLRSLGYDIALMESGETDAEFEAVLDQVDPNRCVCVCACDTRSNFDCDDILHLLLQKWVHIS